ncbi:MAG: hypothetical protein ACRDGG_06405 [Anaerolineae bacterium]
MKCINLIIVMMLVMVPLAACGGAGVAATVEAPGNAGNSASTALDTSYEGALPVMNQLALGSMLLDDTGQALSAEQAAKLLPLWQALRGVLSSQNPAQAEIDALLKQIESGMTADQIAAIRDMQLTQSSIVEWAQSNGVSLDGAFGPGSGQGGGFSPELRATIQAGGEMPPEIQATIEARRAQGGGGFGDFSPEAQATFQAGGGLSPEARATLQAQGGPGGFRGASLAILDRLIDLLEARASQ